MALINLLSRWLGNGKRGVESNSQNVFGDYDIRGQYPHQINEEFFRRFAVVIAKNSSPKTVVVGRDSRRSSLALTKALADGFLSCGVDVIDVGLATAPYGAWLSRSKRIETYIVTASHNPPGENGLKLYSKAGEPISGGELGAVETELARFNSRSVGAKRGRLRHDDFKKSYQTEIAKMVGNIGARQRVAVDYMHGTVGVFLNEILEKKKVIFQTLREDPTGEFPNYGPNPLVPESQKEISHFITTGRYSCGALFDSDGDRAVFFDETGERVETAHTAALFCEYFFTQKGAWRNIVVPVNFSKIIDDVASSLGGKVIRSPVGRVNLAPLMRENRAPVGAERSGHYFFKDFYYHDNAILAFLILLKVLHTKKEPLSKLVEPYKKYITLPEQNIPYITGTEHAVTSAVRAAFPGWRVDRTDGLTVDYKEWWFNLRRSRTEEVWRLSVEALEESMANEKLEEIEKTVKQASVATDEK